jgi:hypothetical protein
MSELESLNDGADTNTEAQTMIQMMQTIMESHNTLAKQVAELAQKQQPRSKSPTPNDLEESFSYRNTYMADDVFSQNLQTPKDNRRSSMLLHELKAKDEQKAKDARLIQHLATATPFQTQALQGTTVDYIALSRLRSDKRFHANQPGNSGATIYLWQNNYIPELTRRKVMKKWKQYLYSDAKSLMYPTFTIPTEESLQTMDFDDLFSLLEIAIIPEDGQDYEKAIGDIVQRLMEKNSYYSIAAQPYFLQQLTTTIEHVEMYLTIAPEAYNGKQTPYNLGTRKNHQHGTKGTVAAFMDKCMPPEMQHAIAVLMRQTATPQTLKEHFKGLKKTINDLEIMLHQYNSYLKACTAAKARKPDSSAAISEIGDKTSPSSVITQPVTADLESLTADQTQHSEDQSTEHTAAMGDATQKKVDITELKETPCYAFIEGKCNSNTCLRSHDKKQILAYLEEKQKQLRGRL